MKNLFFSFFLAYTFSLTAQSNQVFRNVKSDYEIHSNAINDITQDANGFMWLATFDGLFRYDGYEVIPFKNDR